MTPAQISDKIAGCFKHSNDINQSYLRRTFDNMGDALAKKGVQLSPISEDEAGPSLRAPENAAKKPVARKQPAPKPTPKPKPAPKPTPQAPPPASPPHSPPVIITGLRRSARGLVPSLTRKLVM